MFNKLKNKPTEVERNSLYLVKDTPGMVLTSWFPLIEVY